MEHSKKWNGNVNESANVAVATSMIKTTLLAFFFTAGKFEMSIVTSSRLPLFEVYQYEVPKCI
jgi:hypothetical protein